MAFSFETVYIVYVAHLLATYVVLLLGSCLIMITFADELKQEFGNLTKNDKTSKKLEVIIEEPELEQESMGRTEEISKEQLKERSEEGRKKGSDRSVKGNPGKMAEEMTGKYKQFIEFHTDVKKLSKKHSVAREKWKINDIFLLLSLGRNSSNDIQPMAFIIFLWSLLAGCGSLLMIEIKIVKYLIFHLFYL